MPTLTRGPLPPGVYWRRRAFALLLAGTLVFVIASWLGGGSDGSSTEAPVARQAAGEPASQTVTVGERDRGKKQKAGRVGRDRELGPSFDPSVLADPEGPCNASDIVVTPQVEDAVAGRDVTIGLSLQTLESEACTWRVTPGRVALKISDGEDEIWTSRHCPQALPEEEVVVRRVVATVVEMTWHGRESDEGCPGNTDWVMDGDYTIAAAALGGEPRATEFDLASPTPETIAPGRGEKDEKDRKSDGEKQREDRQADSPDDWEAGDAGGAGGNDEPTR
ncbi:MAG TPA: hypothetical protein VD859_04910 [Nocardioides sp.]|nr:hypothetical protein [Nocardioides sp.]